jgi:glucose/arabinose dehydrogenase
VVLFPLVARGEIDQRPLPLDVVPAFARLQWPNDLTGADRGLHLDVRPLVVAHAGDGSGRLFVATQHGAIFVLAGDAKSAQPQMFLDLRERVSFDEKINEEGFMDLAFHPNFKENGQFFVYYTDSRADQPKRRSVISRFRVDATDPTRGDPASEEVLLHVEQPYWNHNGGTLAFGPEGYLYIVLGDGGAGNDPHMNGQNLQSLLGKILRIDVDHQDPGRAYAIPADNPFAGQKDLARGEIWAYGLRNVWRLTFDRETGQAWAADVGQNLWEEINLIHRGGNYGWNLREGKHPFGPGGVPAVAHLVDPIWEYGREDGKSITGGYVYRGKRVPELAGAYLYGDYVSGKIWALWYDADSKTVTANRLIRESGPPIITFGEDDQGEVYFATQEGQILQFVSAGGSPPS